MTEEDKGATRPEQGQLLSIVVFWNVSEVKRTNKSCSEERGERKCSKALRLFLLFNFIIYKLENIHLMIYKIFSRYKTQGPVSISFHLCPNALSSPNPSLLDCLVNFWMSLKTQLKASLSSFVKLFLNSFIMTSRPGLSSLGVASVTLQFFLSIFPLQMVSSLEPLPESYLP